MIRLGIAAGLLVACAVGITFYGKQRYNEGVTDTTAAFIAADKKGAETVHETARKTLDGIGSDVDFDSLLESTGGFRD